MCLLTYMQHCSVWALRPCSGLFLKTEGRARLLKSMGISQPRAGFERTWSVCGGKLEPVQLKVHREWLILFHIIFFSAAKEWHASVVCPCCLLGKEYLSSSDRCWHYHPYVLPSTGTQPMHKHGLTGARTRQTAAHWFWMGKMATLILAGAGDDVIIMVLIHTASQKKLILPEHPLPEA